MLDVVFFKYENAEFKFCLMKNESIENLTIISWNL